MTSLALHRYVSVIDLDEGAVLLDERSGRYWQLNGTAALVLHALLDGATKHSAAQRLADQYPVTVERASADVMALVNSLRAAKLVAS